MNHRTFTLVGPHYDGNAYLTHRIDLNKERGVHGNGHHKSNGHARESLHSSPSDVSSYLANGQISNVTDRGTHGTIRFMIDPSRERNERQLLNEHPYSGRGLEISQDSPCNGRS